jgi:hypothetical protein
MMTEQKKILAYRFLNRFNDLEKVIKDGRVYYVDKDRKPLFFYFQNKKNEYIYINYDRIWSFFEEFFLMEYEEIQGILKGWLEEVYKIRGFIPKQKKRIINVLVGRGI